MGKRVNVILVSVMACLIILGCQKQVSVEDYPSFHIEAGLISTITGYADGHESRAISGVISMEGTTVAINLGGNLDGEYEVTSCKLTFSEEGYRCKIEIGTLKISNTDNVNSVILDQGNIGYQIL